MIDTAVHPRCLDPQDEETIGKCLSAIRFVDIDAALADLAPELPTGARAVFHRYCRVSHVAALVFPTAETELIRELKEAEIDVTGPIPSVVVRDRLGVRYGIAPHALPVSIVHLRSNDSADDDPSVELFVLPSTSRSDWSDLKRRERDELNETHLAFAVHPLGVDAAITLHELLVNQGRMTPDSCGYNEFEDCTVLYYGIAPETPHRATARLFRRLELRIPGRCARALELHRRHQVQLPDESATLPAVTNPDAAVQLLRLMTGAWATQAIAVAATMGLPDRIPGPHSAGPGASLAVLARQLGARREPLARLLQYLASIGIVTGRDDRWTLTELGALLREDAPYSMHALARMYGGPFYHSFAGLEDVVRSGTDAFTSMFGQGHFDYFATRPELAELFDASMAASAVMFEPVADRAEFADARWVVDIAGGNGRLLCAILRRWPHLRGTLFERVSVVARAQAFVADSGCLDRCDLRSGDFTEAVPAGADVYVLSRVLHDWDDEKCVDILRNCAAAIPADAHLLVIERLLNTSGPATLASAWDLHMLCNVGGRERTAQHYVQLLATAGFEVNSMTNLPLDGHLLACRRSRES